MLKKKNKRGFTIVELVIVIAVIGILAGILIPMFSNLIAKANLTSDGVLVRELNNAIAMDAEVKGKHETIHDALKATDEYGFNVQRINAKASQNKILWDSKNDVFCYLKDGVIEYISFSGEESQQLQAGDYRLWVVSNNVDAEYSTYLYKYTGNGVIQTSKGLDVGDEKVNSVTYSHTGAVQNVVIRTNGGSLTINAENDKVTHYGIANKVDIQAVASTSYVENGIVSIAKIKTGRIVVTPEAVLTSIHVVETNGNYNNIKVAVVGNAELPGFTRDEVTMNDGDKKLVIEVQSIATLAAIDESPEYIWISKTAGTTTTDVATSSTTLNDETKVPDASQTTTAKAVATDAVEGTTAEQLAEMEAVATRYAGGQGTESNPYLLATKAHFGSIDEDYHNGVTAGKYYKLVADLDLGKIYPIGSMSLVGNAGTASQGYTITYTDTFKGNIDGDNHTITYTMITDNGLANGSNSIGLFGAIEKAVIKNLTINANITGTRNSVWVGGLAGFGWYCDLENITINGSVTGKHDVGGFFGYYANEGINTTNKFKNCVNNATVTCNSGRSGDNYAICGGFIGQLSVDDSSSYNEYSLIFENCQSNGSIIIGTTTAANSAASYFVGFASDNAANNGNNIRFVFNNCSVGNDASFSSTKGDTRTKSNHTIYCGSSDAAITACPAINYVGVTSNLWSVNPAAGANVKIVVNDAEQDMSLYFVQ